MVNKKTRECLEYICLCTTNKGYEGYKAKILADPDEDRAEEKIIQGADPVSGGITLAYTMREDLSMRLTKLRPPTYLVR